MQLFSNEPHPSPSSSGTTPSASLAVPQQNSSHSQTSSQHSSSSTSSSPTGLRASFDQTISSLNSSLLSVSEMQLILQQHQTHMPKKNLTNSGGVQTDPLGASPSNHNARGPISRSRERDDEDVVFDHPSLRLLHASKQPHSSLSQSQDEIPRDKLADGIETALISNGAKQLQLPDLENAKSSNPSSTIPITIMSCATPHPKTGNQALRSPQHHLQSLAHLHQPHYPTSAVQASIPQPLNVSSTSISSSPSCSPSTSSSSLLQSSAQCSPGLGLSSDDDESFRKPNGRSSN